MKLSSLCVFPVILQDDSFKIERIFNRIFKNLEDLYRRSISIPLERQFACSRKWLTESLCRSGFSGEFTFGLTVRTKRKDSLENRRLSYSRNEQFTVQTNVDKWKVYIVNHKTHKQNRARIAIQTNSSEFGFVLVEVKSFWRKNFLITRLTTAD